MATSEFRFHLHLVNGITHRFVQSDAAKIQQIIANVNARIFTLPSLIIEDDAQILAFAGASIVGISFLAEPVPAALLDLLPHKSAGLERLEEISETQYQDEKQRLQPIVAGQPLVTLQEVEFAAGHRCWLKAHISAATTKMQERQILHHFFDQPILACLRQDGGLNVWNRAHITNIALSPKPEAPTNAWPARRVEF